MSATNKNLVLMPAKNIVVEEGFNARHDYGDMDELINSIKENGVRQPVVIQMKDGKPVLRSGHRRIKACMHLGGDISVPCLVEAKNINDEQRLIDMLLFNEGKNFTPYEYAIVFQRLAKECNLTQAEIGKRTGKQQTQVSRYLRLLELPEDVQIHLKNNEVGAEEVLKRFDALKADNKSDEISAVVKAAVEVAKAAGKQRATGQHFEANSVPTVAVASPVAPVAPVVPTPEAAPQGAAIQPVAPTVPADSAPAPVPATTPASTTPPPTPSVFNRNKVMEIMDKVYTAYRKAECDDENLLAAMNEMQEYRELIKTQK